MNDITGGTLKNSPPKSLNQIFVGTHHATHTHEHMRKERSYLIGQRDPCQLYSADQVKSLEDWEFVAVQRDSFMRRGEKWFYTFTFALGHIQQHQVLTAEEGNAKKRSSQVSKLR